MSEEQSICNICERHRDHLVSAITDGDEVRVCPECFVEVPGADEALRAILEQWDDDREDLRQASARIAELEAANSNLGAEILRLVDQLDRYRAENDETPLTREWLESRGVAVDQYGGAVLYGDEPRQRVEVFVLDDAPDENRIYLDCVDMPGTCGRFLTACLWAGIKVEVGP